MTPIPDPAVNPTAPSDAASTAACLPDQVALDTLFRARRRSQAVSEVCQILDHCARHLRRPKRMVRPRWKSQRRSIGTTRAAAVPQLRALHKHKHCPMASAHRLDVRICISTSRRASQLAVTALDCLADGRRSHLVGDLDVPDFAFALRREVGEQLWNDRYVTDLMAAQAEAACDVLERGAAEDCLAVVDAVGTQFVELRAVPAIVHDADQHAHAMATHRLQFLDVEQEPTIALDENELAVATLPACGSHAERVGESVSDRAKLADRREPLGRPAAQLREPSGLVAGAADDVPILWDCAVEGAYRLARIKQTGLDVEGRGVSGLSRDPARQLLGADRSRRRLAGPELLVDTRENRLRGDQRIRLDIDIGGLLPVAKTARRIVHLDPAGLGEVVAATDVVGKARANGEHDFSGLENLPAECREVAAGNADGELMVVE